jgi:hypothetical protein
MKINKVEDGTGFALGVAVAGIGVCEGSSKVRVVCSLAFGDCQSQSRRHLIQGKCSEEKSI